MAPQQNSTLIDDKLEMCSSTLNLPEEELQRYSPILPPKSNLHHQYENSIKNCQSNNNNEENNHNNHIIRTDNYDSYKRQRNYKTYHRSGNGCSRNGTTRSHKHRSISLCGSNSTVEQGNKEIPIWIDDEPRYVSGVTNKTTCNDIIKALIDDEIRNGNLIYCKQTKDGAASRDYSDYVITESWRGIERSYDGNMAILPVWKAWSRVHNEIRLTMKHHKHIKDPQIAKSNSSGLTTLRKYFNKLLRFAKFTKKQHKPIAEKKVEKCLLSKKDAIPDEFFFVILPDERCDKPEGTNKSKNYSNIKPTTEESANQAKAKLLKEKLYRLSETRESIRKRRATSRRSSSSKERNRKHERKRNSNAIDPNACIQRRRDTPIRKSLRNQIVRKINDVDRLYARENTLTKELTDKFKLFKLQNNLYKNPEKNFDISIGQIQRNIENYAEEIIKTEHELLELKNEIKQDISIINNLKRMTLAETNCSSSRSSASVLPPPVAKIQKVAKETDTKINQPDMQFVDNIYEFCDNNASMLV